MKNLFLRGEQLIDKAVNYAHIYTNNRLLIRGEAITLLMYICVSNKWNMLNHIYTYITRLTMAHSVSEKVIDLP